MMVNLKVRSDRAPRSLVPITEYRVPYTPLKMTFGAKLAPVEP